MLRPMVKYDPQTPGYPVVSISGDSRQATTFMTLWLGHSGFRSKMASSSSTLPALPALPGLSNTSSAVLRASISRERVPKFEPRNG